jgi:DNA-binding MarR family transcriptional regulator
MNIYQEVKAISLIKGRIIGIVDKETDNSNNPSFSKTAKYIDNMKQLPSINSFFWLLRCTDALNKYTDMELGTKGSTRTNLAVLLVLLQNPEGISQQKIASQTGRTKQLIVQAIDKLQKKGYVIRNQSSSDRRINHISITKAGIRHLNEVFPHIEDICDTVFSFLRDEEIQQLLPLIKNLANGLWNKIKSTSAEVK